MRRPLVAAFLGLTAPLAWAVTDPIIFTGGGEAAYYSQPAAYTTVDASAVAFYASVTSNWTSLAISCKNTGANSIQWTVTTGDNATATGGAATLVATATITAGSSAHYTVAPPSYITYAVWANSLVPGSAGQLTCLVMGKKG